MKSSRRHLLALSSGALVLAGNAAQAGTLGRPLPATSPVGVPPASANGAPQGSTPPGTPPAGSPIDKAQVGYQDVPRDGKVCAQCVYFIFKPAVGNTPQSRCRMVAGPINPAGWCEIWAPRTVS
jgi:hypothetical protein